MNEAFGKCFVKILDVLIIDVYNFSKNTWIPPVLELRRF